MKIHKMEQRRERENQKNEGTSCTNNMIFLLDFSLTPNTCFRISKKKKDKHMQKNKKQIIGFRESRRVYQRIALAFLRLLLLTSLLSSLQ
jgi:hypothetical protein